MNFICINNKSKNGNLFPITIGKRYLLLNSMFLIYYKEFVIIRCDDNNIKILPSNLFITIKENRSNILKQILNGNDLYK